MMYEFFSDVGPLCTSRPIHYLDRKMYRSSRR
jgi:hypothetical protein